MVGDVVEKPKKVTVLVELEPKEYRLEDVLINDEKVERRFQDKKVDIFNLTNPSDEVRRKETSPTLPMR